MTISSSPAPDAPPQVTHHPRQPISVRRLVVAGLLMSLLGHAGLLLAYRLFNKGTDVPRDRLIEVELSASNAPKNPEKLASAPKPPAPPVRVARAQSQPKLPTQPRTAPIAKPLVAKPPVVVPRSVPRQPAPPRAIKPAPVKVLVPVKPPTAPSQQPARTAPKLLPNAVPKAPKTATPKTTTPKTATPDASTRRRERTTEQPASAPGRRAFNPEGARPNRRRTNNSAFDATRPKDTNIGDSASGENNAQPDPLPRGERAGRRDAGSPDSPDDRSSGFGRSGVPGGGTPDQGQSTTPDAGGSALGRNPEMAGSDGAGRASSSRVARRGGGGRSSADVFTYNDPTRRDPDRADSAPGQGPGADGGVGGGRSGGAGRNRGRGAGSSEGTSERFARNSRDGAGLGDGRGSLFGGGPGRARSGGGELAGDGGNGGGRGGGSGAGRGRGRFGSGGRGNRGRMAGNPFGVPSGSDGGNPDGGGGNGGGPGGTGGNGPGGNGRGPRYARGGNGNGDGNGENGGGNGGFGRGRRGNGDGGGGNGGNGNGNGGNGRGDGSDGNGRGGRNGDGESAGDGSGGRGGEGAGIKRGRRLALERARFSAGREAGRAVGRGLWAPGLIGRYYQDPDRGELPPGHAIDWPTLGASGSVFKTQHVSKTIDFDWGTDSPLPGVRGTYWSVRWTGKIFVPKTDDYRFFLGDVDDGGRLLLDGQPIIEVWRVQKSSPGSGVMRLERGAHAIVMEYAQGPATASSVRLQWESSSFPRELVGSYQPGN